MLVLRYDLIKQLLNLLLSCLSSFSLIPHSYFQHVLCNINRGGDECLCVIFQGRITVTGLLDRERGDVYTLTVVADDGGPKKDSTVVRFIYNLCLLYRTDFISDFVF